MAVWIKAPIWGQSGYEVLSRGIAIALDKLGVQVQIEPKDSWNFESCPLSLEDETRLLRMCNVKVHPNSYNIVQQYPSVTYLNSPVSKYAKKRFCFSLFETNRCPVPWIPLLNQMTETWVFSDFNVKTYTDSGILNTRTIPFGIDTKLFTPVGESFNFTPKREGDFIFATNGDYTERKNFEGLIEAYVKEFTDKDKVCLLVKIHSNGFIKRYKDECVRRLKTIVQRFNSINPPRILFVGDKVPYEEMPKFYRAADCFVLFSRGEGLGLPYAEALACGVGVISTNFGGQMQFLNDKNALFANSDVKVIDDLEYIKKCLWALNHSWAHPHVSDMREKMRYAYEMRDDIKEKGLQGRADMEKLTWQNVALRILERIYA